MQNKLAVQALQYQQFDNPLTAIPVCVEKIHADTVNKIGSYSLTIDWNMATCDHIILNPAEQDVRGLK